MAIVLVQDKVNAACTAASYCSSRSLSGVFFAHMMFPGFAAGPATFHVTGVSGGAPTISVMWEWAPPISVRWLAGTWVIRLDVTAVTGASVFLQQIDICRLNSSCVNQANVATWTGSAALRAGAVLAINVTQSSQVFPNSGDKVWVALAFRGGGFLPTFTFRAPSVANDTPWRYRQVLSNGRAALDPATEDRIVI